MRKIQFLFLVLAAGLIMTSCNSGTDEKSNDADSVGSGAVANGVDESDAQFLNDAAYSGMMEIEASKTAQSKGQAKEVKDLANMMVSDHTALGDKVKALASKKNVMLRDSLSTDDAEKVRKVKKTGAEFDKDYTSMMVDDHEAAIKKFEDASNNAKDPEIKALATEALPQLRHHLDMAKAAKDKVKG